RLRFLAESTGGEYLNLAAETAEQGADTLKTCALSFLRATYEPGALQELYPSAGALVRGSFGLAGKLSKDRVRITLHFGYGKDERFTRVVNVGGEESTLAPVARLWAQKKLQQLMLEPELHHASILQLGQAFSIVTPDTSLIVLDALSDYVRYHIVPPAEMQADYFRQVQDEDRGKKDAEQRHLESLLNQFKERQTWWATDFKPLPLAQRTREMKDVRGAAGNAVGNVVGGAPPPPSPSETPRPAAQRAEARAPESPAARVDMDQSRVSANLTADRLSEAAKTKKEDGKPEAEPEAKGTITLKAWNPDTPYLKTLAGTPKADRYAIYLKLRAEYGSTPGFFLDVSDLFFRDGNGELALRILSNIAELKLEDATLLRVLGYRLKQLGQHRLSVWASEEVLRMREEEPQSTRDLALACAADGQEQRAADLLWNVVKKPWDGRFRDVNIIALGELNALIATAKTDISTANMDSRFIRNLPVDVRVVLNWDTDNSDMDLHVIDPRGEECYYSHARTELGGRISADVTGGYGPEEFMLKRAVPGTYKVRANYFGTRQQSVIGATTVSLELYLHYASGKVENKSVILRLTGSSRLVDVGEFVFVK
ncbi:MAG: YfaP family protein, partial [Acidobacteriota bacterium]|nr:YfaP family protein [Acidobacteriota bacterium]